MRDVLGAISYSFLFPPMLLVAVALLGTVAGFKWPRAGCGAALASLLILCAFATPFLSLRLLAALEEALPAQQPGAAPGAIVVFGADVQTGGESEAGDTLGSLSLERVFMAAHDYRARQLPILVSGNRIGASRQPVAAMMAEVLEDDLKVPVRWREAQARNTFENAEFSAEILRENGISTVILVAQRWDMPRAIWSLRSFGITAVPTGQARFMAHPGLRAAAFVPTAQGMVTSFVALHELLGLYYYRWTRAAT